MEQHRAIVARSRGDAHGGGGYATHLQSVFQTIERLVETQVHFLRALATSSSLRSITSKWRKFSAQIIENCRSGGLASLFTTSAFAVDVPAPGTSPRYRRDQSGRRFESGRSCQYALAGREHVGRAARSSTDRHGCWPRSMPAAWVLSFSPCPSATRPRFRSWPPIRST